MVDHDVSSTGSSRGKGFPLLPLQEAVAAVKSAGKYGRQHSHAAFAGYLGHDSTNSGRFRAKMAALRDWGLIDRAAGEQVRLSELGHKIAHPSSPDEERTLLQEAFFNADLFKSIFEDSAKETDLSLEFIGNRAVTGLGVAAQSKQRFADSFAKSAVAAGLGQLGSKGSLRLMPPGSIPASAEHADNDDRPATPASGPEAARKGQLLSSSPSTANQSEVVPTLHQRWQVDDGSVLFEVRLSGPLPSSAFSALANVVTSIEGLVATLMPSPQHPMLTPSRADHASE